MRLEAGRFIEEVREASLSIANVTTSDLTASKTAYQLHPKSGGLGRT